jgi:hypothetical protein
METCWPRKDVLSVLFCVVADKLTKQKRVVSLLKNKMLISLKMSSKGEHFFYSNCVWLFFSAIPSWYPLGILGGVAIRTVVECMSCPLGPSIAPPNFLFLFLKEFVQDCAILWYLWIAQSPFLLFLIWSPRVDPTRQVIVPLKSSSVAEGWQEVSYAHQWVWTQNLFEFPESQTGGYATEPSPMRPRCPFWLQKHSDSFVHIRFLKYYSGHMKFQRDLAQYILCCHPSFN